MQVWEAHRDLSLSLGDTCNPTPAGIPNGVRYGRALRDSYIYRAMLDIYRQVFKVVSAMPRREMNSMLTRLMPSLVTGINFTPMGNTINGGFGSQINGFNIDATYGGTTLTKLFCSFTQPNGSYNPPGAIPNNITPFWRNIPIHIISLRIIQNQQSYPIPMKNHAEEDGLLNQRNVQRPDMFADLNFYYTTTGNNSCVGCILDIYDAYGVLSLNDNLILKYLPHPLNPAFQAPSEELIGLDELWYEKMIALARMYAMTDSQDDSIALQTLGMELQQGG